MLAEGSVILIVWLLNRKNIVANFKIHILQSFAEMMWTSPELKIAVQFTLYACILYVFKSYHLVGIYLVLAL